MVVHSPAGRVLEIDLVLAKCIGAECVELLPRWNDLPDPHALRRTIEGSGLKIWSVHGPWGGRTIRADKVDLADTNARLRQESVDDIRRASDWAADLGTQVLVVHPGGLSDPESLVERTDRLTESLAILADNAIDLGMRIGVENMPRGVYPGSRMADLAAIVRRIGHPNLGLTLDTGHARISADVTTETLSAEGLLISTHVHENDGRADSHRPPGEGSIDWRGWFETLDRIGYEGPIMLECIRALREAPERPTPEWIRWWSELVAGHDG
jgi:sugar phosphate isomerase/epimerase